MSFRRYEMLRWLRLYLRAERMGALGELMDPRDAGLPFYAMARSYAKVADAVRTMSLLKAVKDSQRERVEKESKGISMS